MARVDGPTIRCWSFHSVKGGVGKSTLSLALARRLARALSGDAPRVVLLDMDLTGTSLADAIPLLAPTWDELTERLPLHTAPDRHVPPHPGIERRAAEADPRAMHVPYLNDWLLHRMDVDHETPEAAPAAFLWRDEQAPALRVIPSSALPGDLSVVLPMLYDEPFAAYVERRLELLLAGLVELGVTHIVVDTPPTLPGLSRAVLSLALRVPEGQPLARGASLPRSLRTASLSWQPWVVTSRDRQDLRAVERWLEAIDDEDDRDRLGVVINRCDASLESLRAHYRAWGASAVVGEAEDALNASADHLFRGRRRISIPHDPLLRLFDVEGAANGEGKEDALRELLEDEEWVP